MLAEMARAFNLGLGLNGGGSGGSGSVFGGFSPHHGNNNDNTRGEGVGGDAENEGRGRELPPEGSFERFLVELQADLRVVLSLDSRSEEEEERGDRARNENETEQEEEVTTGRRARGLSVGSLVPTEPAESVHSVEDPNMPALQDVTDDDSSDGQAELSDDDDGTSLSFCW